MKVKFNQFLPVNLLDMPQKKVVSGLPKKQCKKKEDTSIEDKKVFSSTSNYISNLN